MDTQAKVPPMVLKLLDDMLASDGYGVIVHEWPEGSTGRARLEVIARDGACADCLVPKQVLAQVLCNAFPEGIVIDESDLIYPADVSAH